MTELTRLTGFPRSGAIVLAAAGLAIGLPAAVVAQDSSTASVAQDQAPAATQETTPPGLPETTKLAFKNVSVDQVIPFIVESTGKVVLPIEVGSRKITILNDREIPRKKALDLVFFAFQQNGIAVVETEDLITLRDISEIGKQDVPVIPADKSVLNRTDLGTVVEKVFALRHGSAENMGEILKDAVPDFAKMVTDKESNQIVITGNIGLLQRMERVISSLDQPNAASLSTETFRLRYADSTQIANNINQLFGTGSQSNSNQNNRNSNFPQFFLGGGEGGGRRRNADGGGGGSGSGGGQDSGQGAVSTSQNLRVTANSQQNSVTVLAEPAILDQIRDVIDKHWDIPLEKEQVVPRTYELKNSDPVKVRDLLEGLFGQGTSGTSGNNNNNNNNSSNSQGVGRLAGQFSFQAIPESARLVVVGKSPDNMQIIDEIIADLDKPQTAGLPRVMDLKHANSEELAEQLNALLALEGTSATVRRADSGLSDDSSSASPFATDQQDNATTQTQTTTETLSFWWQRARVPTTSAGSSNLVGRIRIVPIARQNALMIMSPPEYMEAVVSLIQDLDKPGRQVLIKAIIAEVSLEDATSLGLRFSSQAITPTNADNSVSIGTNTTGTENNLLGSLFDTSVLNLDTDLNVVLQALNQKTGINILSEPRIFTSDNQEAEFFDGQDIPFVTDSQTTDQGNVVQSFDYRAVGIQLRVRPRITPTRQVDLNVNLELSSIQPSQTLFGGFIVDRRETTTQLIVADGQTVVISGILRSEESSIKRKIPLLGDIPLVGGLFRSTEKSKANTELIAFITPVVILNNEETDSSNAPDRAKLDSLRSELHAPDLMPAAGENGAENSDEHRRR